MDAHYVQSHIASCEACTYVVHNPASKVASLLGLPTVQFLIACSTPKLHGWWKGLQRYHEVDRSSALTRDQVYGWRFSYM